TERTGHTVLCVARLDRDDMYKGVDMLLRAWPRVLEGSPDARLVVVGDGNDRPRLAGIAASVGVEAAVEFRRRVPDNELGELYRTATVFALPGRARMGPAPEGEGFGLVFIEAQAAGLPPIAGRAAGAMEALVDGETGLFVDPDDPEDIARG